MQRCRPISSRPLCSSRLPRTSADRSTCRSRRSSAILTPDARDRLSNIRVANRELADSVEMQLIQLAQSGRLQNVVTDAMLRDILRQVAPQHREITIERR